MMVRENGGKRAGQPGSTLGVYAALFGSLMVIPFASCIYDSNHRCGPNEVLKSVGGEVCVCDENSASTTNGCVRCGANEVVATGGCQCAAGFSRTSPNEPCIQGMNGGAGLPNSGGDSGTPGAAACTSDAQCANGQACDTKVSPSVCRTPPIGLGKPCTAASDCAGTEATFCDVMVTKACAVEGCSLSPDNCFPGYVCCDLAKFGLPTTLCAVGPCL